MPSWHGSSNWPTLRNSVRRTAGDNAAHCTRRPRNPAQPGYPVYKEVQQTENCAMPNYQKLILACLLCLAVIVGLVLLVERLF